MSTSSPHLRQRDDNPETPIIADDLEWFTAYAKIHMLSQTSWRYAYIFWLAIGLVALIFSVFHLFGLRSGAFGAHWSKWSLRRRTWRKKHSLAEARKSDRPHKQPLPLPSNAQLLCLLSLIVACLAATFVGPDYIAPVNRLWGFRRSLSAVAASPIIEQPQYTIQKAWWTSGGRAGLVSFALFPLCILFALKRPPFAIFAIPFFTNLHFDKLIWLHRWTGRLIWFMVALHTALWSVQLANDKRSGTDKVAYVYAWQYQKFIYAWIAFGLLTLLTLLSLGPIRDKHYETFYALHILLVPATIVMSALHHPPLWWWCWVSLFLWVGERVWRATNWVYINGIFGTPVSVPLVAESNPQLPAPRQGWEMHPISPDLESATDHIKHSHASPATPRSPNQVPRQSPYNSTTQFASSAQSLLPSAPSTFSIPTGFAHAEVLAGRTIRIRLITPGQLSWAPGQHFLLCIPSVSALVSHPFTCASICDEQRPSEDGRTIMFLIRAKNGWTKDLWTTVVALLASGHRNPANEAPPGTLLPPTGVLLRAWVDGPFGSPARTNWGLYSSALIVSGGSGVSFGLAVLEYLCLCMAGRNGRFLGGNVGRSKAVFATRRVRFVWIVRDFAHMQWCATVLRRCKSLIPPESLQIELFVTNFNTSISLAPRSGGVGILASPYSPTPPLSALRPVSDVTISGIKDLPFDHEDSMPDVHADDYVDLSYYTGEFTESGELGHEEHQLDLTNFDGDNDDRVPGESSLNRAVKKEGTVRRGLSRQLNPKSVKRALDQSNKQIDSPTSPRRIGHLLLSPPHQPGRPTGLSVDTSVLAQRSPGSSRLSGLTAVSPASRGTSPVGWDSPLAHGERVRFMEGAQDWDRRSIVSAESHVSSVHALLREVSGGYKLELDDQEMQDIRVMAEFARPGRPKLDLILRDEVTKAKGRIVVACKSSRFATHHSMSDCMFTGCGPTTLNAVVRKAVAAQIDPARIRRGDNSGSIELVAEDFAY
ncbi:hypothetical protein BC834DRAFT_921742 [Gloeopeniophorella convolvens]|nr:hypothetical protein BC834DRAFT_921742 [Gloeopeniophorella convolvens]